MSDGTKCGNKGFPIMYSMELYVGKSKYKKYNWNS